MKTFEERAPDISFKCLCYRHNKQKNKVLWGGNTDLWGRGAAQLVMVSLSWEKGLHGPGIQTSKEGRRLLMVLMSMRGHDNAGSGTLKNWKLKSTADIGINCHWSVAGVMFVETEKKQEESRRQMQGSKAPTLIPSRLLAFLRQCPAGNQPAKEKCG